MMRDTTYALFNRARLYKAYLDTIHKYGPLSKHLSPSFLIKEACALANYKYEGGRKVILKISKDKVLLKQILVVIKNDLNA